MASHHDLLASERVAIDELRSRMSELARARTAVLAGPTQSQLATTLEVFAREVGADYIDLASEGGLAALTAGAPFYGGELDARLSGTMLRRFIQAETRTRGTRMLAVHVPAVIWKLLVLAEPDGAQRFLEGLREWRTDCGLVVTYPLDADSSSLNKSELDGRLGRHLVVLKLTDAENHYLQNRQRDGSNEQ